MKLTISEDNVLYHLSNRGPEYCLNFKALMSMTGLDRVEVRNACRSLAENRLAYYSRGLWNFEEDMPAGSGYGISPEGMKWIDSAATQAREG